MALPNNIQTDLSFDKANFQFVSQRQPSADNGNGRTEQYFRFRDEDDFPVFIISASKDYIERELDKDLLRRFISSVSEEEGLYQNIADGWVKSGRNADVKKYQYFYEGFKMTVYYDSAKDIKKIKDDALINLSKIED